MECACADRFHEFVKEVPNVVKKLLLCQTGLCMVATRLYKALRVSLMLADMPTKPSYRQPL